MKKLGLAALAIGGGALLAYGMTEQGLKSIYEANRRLGVALFYVKYLRRPPDVSGWNFWTNFSQTSGLSFDKVRAEFLAGAAPELQARGLQVSF